MRSAHRRSAFRSAAALAALTAILLVRPVATQERDRAQIPDRYKWNLADIYPSEAAWRAARDHAATEIPTLESFRGRLSSSASALADGLGRQTAIDQELSRLSAYASLLGDEDTRDAAHQGMRQQMQQLFASFSAARAFVEPEILQIGRPTLDRFLQSEPRLAVYRFALDNIERRAPHTLDADGEHLLADAGPAANTGANVFAILTNADFPYPKVTLSDGRMVTLDEPQYETLRGVPVRADRRLVMSSFFDALGRFRSTLGALMNGEIQKDRLRAKARHYDSDLAAALDGANIPASVYTRLVDGINRNLSTFHRYLRLRRRMLGVDQLHYYDLYAPLVASVDLKYTPDQALHNVVDAVAPLGPEYSAVLSRAYDDRWIDLFPSPGKTSGGYTSGVYGVHPYVLINFDGGYEGMTTIAHELGHAMHAYLADHDQPYPLAGHPIFVSEVASTFNEQLLIDHMLDTIKDDDTRLSLLGRYLENAKSTMFRQTQFAEFELKMHQMAQEGQPITGEALAKLYLDITRKYYGHDRGICIVDADVANEWSYVPHFYYDFYVFQYATSFTASTDLASKVEAGGAAGRAATEKYLRFLSAGGSKYPIDLLKEAGVDMTTDEPLDLTIQRMNRVMDEMERILDRKGR
jgi:oligoendopeptidase F